MKIKQDLNPVTAIVSTGRKVKLISLPKQFKRLLLQFYASVFKLSKKLLILKKVECYNESRRWSPSLSAPNF